MRISSKADYAIRAIVELAGEAAGGADRREGLARPPMIKAEQIAAAQEIPLKFLLNILVELKRAGIVRSQRGAEGGYQLDRPASKITLADIIRVVEGPLAQVGDMRPEELRYTGSSRALQDVWIAVRANLRAILESVTIEQVLNDTLPPEVRTLVASSDSWVAHFPGQPAQA